MIKMGNYNPLGASGGVKRWAVAGTIVSLGVSGLVLAINPEVRNAPLVNIVRGVTFTVAGATVAFAVTGYVAKKVLLPIYTRGLDYIDRRINPKDYI